MPDAQPVTRTAAEIEAELASINNNTADLGTAEDSTELDIAPSNDYESEASRQGWVPRDKYRGDAAKWVDAKTFVERGERFASHLQREVASLKQKLEDFEGTKAAFVKF